MKSRLILSLAAAAGFVFVAGTADAQAFGFLHRGHGCGGCEPTCCEQPACEPTCCEPADCCEPSCGKRHRRHHGHRRHCEPTCCEQPACEPTCCEPTDCCETDCCDDCCKPSLCDRMKAFFHRCRSACKKSCCEPSCCEESCCEPACEPTCCH